VGSGSFLAYQLGEATLGIMTTGGVLRIDCDQPRWLLRDAMRGKLSELHSGQTVGDTPFPCRVATTSFSTAAQTSGILAPPPDNVPILEGVLLFEMARWSMYHPFTSFQFAAVTRSGNLVVALAEIAYLVNFAQEVDVRTIIPKVADGIRSHRNAHFTLRSPSEYLGWLPQERLHCLDIRQSEGIPDNIGETFIDCREDPDHAAFKKKVERMRESPSFPGGMDL
jgi:hypothetical protein